MPRRLLIRLIILAIVVAVLAVLPRGSALSPDAPTDVEAARPGPVLTRHVLRRPSAPAPSRDRAPAPERTKPDAASPTPAVPAEPTDILDLDPATQQLLLDRASEVFAELDEMCGELAGPDAAHVLAAVTLDDRGVLEMELSAYAPELGATAVPDPLPDPLVDCVDDVLWELDWPSIEGGTRFALTTVFDPST
jgi:hypothetical protein